MEDAHATILDLDNPDDSAAAQTGPGKKGKRSFFAVFDGHGGSTVARYAGETVHGRLRDTELYKKQDYPAALKRTFLKTDEDLRANPDYAHDTSGCTAVATLILEDGTIICANAGDSRSVLSLNGEVKPMSYDHKPGNKIENTRIVAGGGFVEFGRVNGNLALSRALGDFEFKQNSTLEAERQIVTADPDIITHTPTGEEEFLIIACDGIWDVLKNQEVVDYTRRCIADGKELHEISESIIETCLAPDSDLGGVGCDNMTFLVIAILGNRTKQEWYDWVRQRVESGSGYQTPQELAKPFANRQTPGPRPGLLGGGSLSGPAQMIHNAINNGTLRFGRGNDDDMDAEDQYNPAPSSASASSNTYNTGAASATSPSSAPQSAGGQPTKTVPADIAGAPPVDINSSAAADKLSPNNMAVNHALSPPSALMGVQSSHPVPSKPNSDAADRAKDDEIAHPAVQADGLMDSSENPLSG